MKEPVLVTGAAGFIGMHVAHRLLVEGHDVVGVDDLNAYYDPHLKQARIKNLEAFTKKLEAQGVKLDRPYTKVPQLGVAIDRRLLRALAEWWVVFGLGGFLAQGAVEFRQPFGMTLLLVPPLTTGDDGGLLLVACYRRMDLTEIN